MDVALPEAFGMKSCNACGDAFKRLAPHYLDGQLERSLFLGESFVAKQMVHPNVVRTFEAGDVGGWPYMANRSTMTVYAAR